MSRKLQQITKNESKLAKFSSQRCKSDEALRAHIKWNVFTINGAKHSLCRKILGGPKAGILAPVTWHSRWPLFVNFLRIYERSFYFEDRVSQWIFTKNFSILVWLPDLFYTWRILASLNSIEYHQKVEILTKLENDNLKQ